MLNLGATESSSSNQLGSGVLNLLDSRLVGTKLGLKPLVLLPQILHSSQVATIVIRGHQKLLLLNPGLLVSDVSEELVQGVGLVEERLAVGGQVLDVLVTLADVVTLVADVVRVKLTRVDKAVRLINHVLDPVLMGNDVCLHQLVLLHQVLHGGKILSNLVSGQNALNLAEPKVEILDCCNEGSLPVCLLQLHRLLAGLLGEQLPLLSNGLQPVLHGFFTSRALLPVDEILAHCKDALNSIGIGSQLSFKGLVLLVLGLDVSGVLVVLLLGQLQLLQHPGLDLISIP